MEANFIQMGFIPNESIPIRSLNVTKLLSFVVLFMATTFECVLLKRSNTFEQYAESIYVTSATIMFASIYTATTFKIPSFFKFINNYQKLVDASK